MKYKNVFYFLLVLIVILLVVLVNNKQIEGFSNNSMKNYSVIFGATLRDVDKYLEKNLENIEKCGKKFKSFAVVIYENDSKDNTVKILEEKKKDNYHYIIETGKTTPIRTMRIANGRNNVLEKAQELNANNTYDYLIMLDMDDITVNGKFVDSIDSCFNDLDWDVLTGNQSDRYYDKWALRKKGLLDYDCWIEANKAMAAGMSTQEAHNKYIHVFDKFDTGQRLDVDSAFGGIAIYKLSSIGDCKYIGSYEDGTELCEHVPFHQCIKENGGKIYINTDFLTN